MNKSLIHPCGGEVVAIARKAIGCRCESMCQPCNCGQVSLLIALLGMDHEKSFRGAGFERSRDYKAWVCELEKWATGNRADIPTLGERAGKGDGGSMNARRTFFEIFTAGFAWLFGKKTFASNTPKASQEQPLKIERRGNWFRAWCNVPVMTNRGFDCVYTVVYVEMDAAGRNAITITTCRPVIFGEPSEHVPGSSLFARIGDREIRAEELLAAFSTTTASNNAAQSNWK